MRAPGLACDRPLDVGVDRALGEHGLHPLAANLLDEPLDVSRRRLRLRRERRDHRAHHLDAVAAREVAERVVSRNDLALRRRHALDACGDFAVEPVERPDRPGGVAGERGTALRVRLRQCRANRLDRAHAVSRVLPPVGIVVEALHRVDQAHDLGVAAGVVDHVREPVVHLATRAKHDRGAGHRLHVARARLVVVRVAARAQHALDVHAVPAHLPGQVRDLGGGGHYREAAPGSGVVAASNCGEERQGRRRGRSTGRIRHTS